MFGECRNPQSGEDGKAEINDDQEAPVLQAADYRCVIGQPVNRPAKNQLERHQNQREKKNYLTPAAVQ